MPRLRGVRHPASESDTQPNPDGAPSSPLRPVNRRAAPPACNSALVSLLLVLDAAKVYLCASKDSSMSRLPAAALIRWACWCACLLAVALVGNASPGAAEPPAVASSVFTPPPETLDHVLQLASTPEALPTIEPTPVPSPTATPAPPPPPPPTPTPTPQPAAEPTPPPPEPRPTPSPAPQGEGYADPATAAAVYALTNELRADSGLPPLALNDALNGSANSYAAVLATYDWFAHEGPDGSTIKSRAEAAGYSSWIYLSENLYRGFYGDAAERIVQAWADSPGHLSNLTGQQITEIGVGCYISGNLRWCVQDFGDR